jgi:CheY-like chemotaxis protein
MGSLKCLVVDDQYDFGLTFSEILKLEGFEAYYTTSAIEALEKISEVMYDVIFLDVNMPEISGIEMLKQIPKVSQNNPSCIMVTGYSDSEIIISAMNAGAIGYLTKPIDMEKLGEILTKVKNTVKKSDVDLDTHNFSNLDKDEKDILRNISDSRLSKISLQFKDVEPVFTGIDIDGKWIDVMKILNKLSEKNLLIKDEYERVILCPSCDSVETYSRYSCPSCKSTKIDRLNLIQHLKCGHMGHKKEFEENSQYICPKCSPKTHKPKEYKIIGTIFECNECGSRFNKPNINHYCKKCDEYFDYNNSRYIPVYIYSIGNSLKGYTSNDEEKNNIEINNVQELNESIQEIN